MSVTEVKAALGTWTLNLAPETPRELLDALAMFGHIALLPGRVDPTLLGDNLLRASRFVGPVRGRASTTDGYQITGAGMAFWLGDEDSKGDVFVNTVTVASATFANSVRAVLPPGGSVVEGTLFAIPGSPNFTSTFQYQTPRDCIQYITDTYSTATVPVSWRVNGDATLDAGRDSDLFRTTPNAILVRTRGGRDMDISGYKGSLELDADVEDYTTKVVLLAEGDGAATVTASASLVTPYRDIRGNLVRLTRLVSEYETDGSNAQARAQLQLNRFTNPRQAVSLSTEDYDVNGTFAVGDSIMVHDPDIGFVDPLQEVYWRGQAINPVVLPVTELTWPIPGGWTVAYRSQAGVWYDLSAYYVPETGTTTVVVGGISKALTDSSAQPVGSRPVGDSSVPAAPVFGATSTGSYQTDNNGTGQTFAQVQLSWTQPLNTDGSTIVDGDHYEIRYRSTASGITTSWQNTAVGWGTLVYLVTGLLPGTSYDFQIRAVDAANPPNAGAYSSTLTLITSADAIAPSTPAAPTLAASRIAVQVTHTLGKSTGGTYNLEADLDRLEVHAGASSSFTPSNATLIGKLPATVANIRASIPAVGTFNVESTTAVWVKVLAVDTSGNSSAASVGASATALLIDNAHVSDLTVSKVTAGTIAATWINGGTITTAATGARVELVGSGLNAYNAAGSATVQIKGSDGSALITGAFQTDIPTSTTPHIKMLNSGDRTTIYFFGTSGLETSGNYAFMNTPGDASAAPQIGINTGTFTYLSQSTKHRLFMANGGGIFLESNAQGTGFLLGGRLSLDPTGFDVEVHGASGTTLSNVSAFTSFAIINSNNSAGVTQSSIEVTNDGTVFATGRLVNNMSFANAVGDLFIAGSGTGTLGAAATAYSIAYGSTCTSKPGVITQYYGASQVTNRLSAFSTTGFTITLASAVTAQFQYWAWRNP